LFFAFLSKKFLQKYNVSSYNRKIILDSYYWDYSRTTGKYRNQFLGEGIADTRAKIESGEYKLADLQ